MAIKFAQITASLANFTTTDQLIGVQNATADRLFSLPQLASALLTSPNITGHATIEGVLLTGVTGTGALVLGSAPTLGTATLNSPTLNTAIINTATFNNATLNTAILNTATINNATLNTATLNTATLTSPTLTNAVLSAPVLTNPGLSTATINTATINNAALNTATLNNITVNTGTLNNVTLNTATLNSPTLSTATITNTVFGFSNGGTGTTVMTVPWGVVLGGTTALQVLAPGTAGYLLQALGSVTAPQWVGSGGVLLNTITASQLGSAVDTTSFSSRYSKFRIAFENVCPVATATLTCSLNMQIATVGTTWLSASYISKLDAFVGGTTIIIGTTSVFYLTGTQATTCVGTSTVYGVNGYVDFNNPAGTVARKAVNGELNYLTPGAVSTLTNAKALPSGFWDGSSNAIVSFAVAFQTGNIATGTIRVYGIS